MMVQLSALCRGGGTNITKSVQFNIVVKSAIPLDKSFSELTDAEFLAVAQALQSGTITTSDLNWSVGDMKAITSGTYSGKHLVIYHLGSAGIKFTDGTDVHVVVGFKETLTNCFYGSMNNVYNSSILKTEENNIYNALPDSIKPAFKRFKAKTAEHGESSTVTEYDVYMCSPAGKEVFGGDTNSVYTEANALTQFDYFKTSANRIKSSGWWMRSPYAGTFDCAAYADSNGKEYGGGVSYWSYGVSPYGCI